MGHQNEDCREAHPCHIDGGADAIKPVDLMIKILSLYEYSVNGTLE